MTGHGVFFVARPTLINHVSTIANWCAILAAHLICVAGASLRIG